MKMEENRVKLETELNPVVVAAEINWNADVRNDCK
jgi:hypothetical protein